MASAFQSQSWRTALVVFFPLLSSPSTAAEGVDAGALGDGRESVIRALLEGSLDAGVDARALFDVDLDDEKAVQLEAARLAVLLRAVKDASVDVERLPRWNERLTLDRARLEFYELPKARRDELMRAHLARSAPLERPVSPEEVLDRAAEDERARAAEAARLARDEAERAVEAELARLAGVEQAVLGIRTRIVAARSSLPSRKDALLGWQRRERESRSTAEVDATYDALRRTLRSSRDELDHALDTLESTSSDVPDVGSNPLDELQLDFALEARERRTALEATVRDVRAEERLLREETAEALLEEITSLNRQRLGLLDDLSDEKRAATVGLTEAGFDQARAEARHLVLILRYHQDIVRRWVGSLRKREGVEGLTWWRVLGVAVPWVLLGWAFVWWRRRAPRLLAVADQRLAQSDRREGRSTPSRVRRALDFVRGTHRSLEWLAFFALLVWLLPSRARALLEVQLLTVVVGWSLAGAVVVNAINALATSSARGKSSSDEIERLRLRSLRLVGRVVIGFVLVLFVTAELVGEGTLYSWAWSMVWLSAIPVFLILVRWWRTTVFERLDRARRKSRLQAWLLTNRTGWKSFFAAMVAAVQLFVTGTYKAVRNWLAGFDVARKAHAYLYKRELDRLASDTVTGSARPLSTSVREALSPEHASTTWVPCESDAVSERLRTLVSEGGGGVVAVVGPRGQGKSALFRQLAGSLDDAHIVHCTSSTSATSLRATLDEHRNTRVLLLDDAHLLVRPVLGGLRTFDEVLELARRESGGRLWVFALDAVLWPFLRRARDARPVFDEVIELEPWTDEQIGELLTARTTALGFTPAFDDLLERLPTSSDEFDRLEALAARRAGYFRMVWDHARGNPGIALEVWRSSLVEGTDGVRVRPLLAPDTAQLESLPDSSLFVLRSVLQMAPVGAREVASATRLTEAQVQIAFRFGEAHGFLTVEGERVQVSWPWLRAVVVLLERRHLLVPR